MNNRIHDYVEEIFRKYKKLPNYKEKKEEYKCNLEDKYNTLLEENPNNDRIQSLFNSDINLDYLFIDEVPINVIGNIINSILLYLSGLALIFTIEQIYFIYNAPLFGDDLIKITPAYFMIGLFSIFFIIKFICFHFKENHIEIILYKFKSIVKFIRYIISILLLLSLLYSLYLNLNVIKTTVSYTLYILDLLNYILVFSTIPFALFMFEKKIQSNIKSNKRNHNLFIGAMFIVYLFTICIAVPYVENHKQHNIEKQRSYVTNDPSKYLKFGREFKNAGSVYYELPSFIPEYTSFEEDFNSNKVIFKFNKGMSSTKDILYDSVILYSLYPDCTLIQFNVYDSIYTIEKNYLKMLFGENIFNSVDDNEVLKQFKDKLSSMSNEDSENILKETEKNHKYS